MYREKLLIADTVTCIKDEVKLFKIDYIYSLISKLVVHYLATIKNSQNFKHFYCGLN